MDDDDLFKFFKLCIFIQDGCRRKWMSVVRAAL